MQTKLTSQTAPLGRLLTIVGLAIVTAAAAVAAENKDKPNPPASWPRPQMIDPNTGLPLPPPPPWMDPEWRDPDKVLKEVTFDALPLGLVADHLRQEFQHAFDILIPNAWQDPNKQNVSLEPQSLTIKMQLKNVRASEVFNAMNLMFETENTPCRWELKLNGNRPLAMLRVLPERMSVFAQPPPPPTTRMVYFVGDLIDDDKSDGKSLQALVKTVSEVFEMSYGPSKGVLQFHQEAQLIIVTGTGDQIQFVQQTLSALRGKAQAAKRPPPKAPAPPAKPEEPKPR